MKALVTGSEGFIGRVFCTEMMSAGHDVVPFDIRGFGQDDVREHTRVEAAISIFAPDVVVHLAAEVGKLNCEQNSYRAISTNVYGTVGVARACASHKVPLVFVSSSEVYGDWGDMVVAEDCLLVATDKLSGIYALTKRWGEEACRTYAPAGLKIVRPTMPYGPGVPPGPGRRALDNLVWQALTGQPMVVHKDAARSWCWIDDLARGMRYVIESGKPGVYNVGRDDDEVSMVDLAYKIVSCINETGEFTRRIISGSPSLDDAMVECLPDIRIVDPPARQTAVKRISCARLRALGWEPRVDLEDGLPRMVEWMREYAFM